MVGAVILFCLALLGPSPEGLELRFLHEGACETPGCRKESHWKVRVGERTLEGRSELSALLEKEADAHREGAPRPELSERVLLFSGDRSVPWGLVHGTMREGARFGIYKIAWLKAGSEKGELGHKFRLRDPERDSGLCRLGDAGITLRWDPALGLIRRVGHQKPSGSIDELMVTLREEMAILKQAGKPELPVFLDAGEDVLWKDVLDVMDRCRNDGLETLELVPALRRKAAEKK